LNQKNPSQRKRIAYSKKALQSAPSKAAKITGFQVLFRLRQANGRKKIYFKLTQSQFYFQIRQITNYISVHTFKLNL